MNELLRRLLFLPPQASTMAARIDHLHYVVILTTMAGATALALTAAYWVVRYRRKETDPVEPVVLPIASTPFWVELGIAGGLFALFVLWWVVGFRQYVTVRTAPGDAYDVYVTAKQWMWKFAYPEGAHSIAQLYVPAGRPVRLLMTSRDVIHSFFVPDFRLKQDVLPGRYTTLWFTAPEPGTYEVLCAELCGTNHSTMRAEVIALSPPDFGRWLTARSTSEPSMPAPPNDDPAVAIELGPSRPMSLERLGKEVAAKEGCLRCHTLDGTPHIGPSWAGLYRSPVPLRGGGQALADEAYLTESMMDPRVRVHEGYQPVMPSYLGRLRPGEVAAILALIKSLRDRPVAGEPQMPPMDGTVRVGPTGPTGARP